MDWEGAGWQWLCLEVPPVTQYKLSGGAPPPHTSHLVLWAAFLELGPMPMGWGLLVRGPLGYEVLGGQLWPLDPVVPAMGILR